MILYRSVGEAEYRLIHDSGFRKFPPRLPEQPIFYPVLTLSYAREIAQRWNTKDSGSGFRGYVTRFEVKDELAKQYPVQTAGARHHQELWIPAADLEEFNNAILGKIEVLECFSPSEETSGSIV